MAAVRSPGRCAPRIFGILLMVMLPMVLGPSLVLISSPALSPNSSSAVGPTASATAAPASSPGLIPARTPLLFPGFELAAQADSIPDLVVEPEPFPESAGRRQTPEDPVPVLLVPGWGDDAEDLAPLQARFLRASWSLGSVRAVDFEDPVGSSREHAAEVAAAARALRRTTGSPVVDIVAHSMGGLAVRYFLNRARSARDSTGVRKVVFLGTPHRGTVAAWFAWGEGGDEMQPGSPFLDSLNAGPFVPDSVEALAVQTPLDLRVIPGESAVLPEAGNTRNVEICCPTHPGLLDHEDTFRAVVEFLRDDEEE